MPLTGKRSPDRRRELGRFVGVGAAGFLTDALVLTLLLRAGQTVLVSRICSFTCASLLTWWLHRIYTFHAREQRASKGGQYVRYIAVQLIGAAINLGVFLAVVAVVPSTLQWPVVPLAIGAVAGLVFNFIGSSIWAFRTTRDP